MSALINWFKLVYGHFGEATCTIYSGAKYLGFLSSRSLNMTEKFISFAQLAFEGSVFTFRFWMIKVKIMCFFYIIVNFVIQKLISKYTSLKKYTNGAKIIYFFLVLREREEKKMYFASQFLSNQEGNQYDKARE